MISMNGSHILLGYYEAIGHVSALMRVCDAREVALATNLSSADLALVALELILTARSAEELAA